MGKLIYTGGFMNKYDSLKAGCYVYSIVIAFLFVIGILSLIYPSKGECQTPIMPIIPGAPWGCTTIITTTPEGGTRTCLVCTQPGGPTTVSCS